ncbi:MAG TPA: aminoacyl-tRNA deacylase [Deltaproteobacteria bacterium]|nr:aminoacyl-tRNA deacylase [Deltaproteobacteria bacterium]HOM30195.1 aminoacyl-tRNA deacylase [Deltaproteobacteria bacterium]
MKRQVYPVTPAVRVLREKGIPFAPHSYPYVENGGTHQVALSLHIPEHRVIKTLVMKDEESRPFIVLMHGDREVSTRSLARQLGLRHVEPCSERDAQRLTGYLVGGISPFGTKTELPVYAEAGIFDMDRIFINGGKRGFMVEIDPAHLEKALKVTRVYAAVENR